MVAVGPVMVETSPGVGYITEPCPICGVLLGLENLAEVTTMGDSAPRYLPTYCPTPKCGKVCRTCRRDVGDVHGPHCWEHMKDKLENPHLVDRSDCR
jgi:hypothetical protein